MPWTHRTFWILPLLIGGILTTMVTIVRTTRLRHIYNARLRESARERLFLAAVGFFTAVLTVRGITIAIHYDFGPFHDVSMGGRHIHHLVWGILLLLVSGYGWLLQVGTGTENSLRWVGQLMSMTYGVAAALTLDEFALWLNLRDVYWEREGRESFEALVSSVRRAAGDRSARQALFSRDHALEGTCVKDRDAEGLSHLAKWPVRRYHQFLPGRLRRRPLHNTFHITTSC